MADVAGQRRTNAVSVSPLRIKRPVAITFALMVLAACIVPVLLLLNGAERERHALRDQALTTAITLSFSFDQEVAAGKALLRGLSTSPAIKAWDVKLLHDQLAATQIPPGSWLIVNDLEKQVVNTLVPFGASLPRLRDFPTYPEALNRVRDRGWTVSGRMSSLVKPGKTIIALGLRLDADDGSMRGFISTILVEDHLRSILAAAKAPPGWSKGLYDRKLLPIATDRGGFVAERPIPAALTNHLSTLPAGTNAEGLIEGGDEHGEPILIAFRRSEASDWTAVVSVPVAIIDAPVTGVMHKMVGPSAFLVVAGVLLALVAASQVQRPLKSLALLVSRTEREVTKLSDQLLALQEDERQRIARELHDSTAQSLVAAGLYLAKLEHEVHGTEATGRIFVQISAQLDTALQEIRIFTYLLHPPALEEVGLKAALQDFILGFANRTGLSARVGLTSDVDDLAPSVQRSMLRVMQEALANVHRHAGAAVVTVKARRRDGYVYFRVADDGRGFGPRSRQGSAERPRLGVGIPGMRVRLRQLDGDLRVTSGAWGTSVLAYVPVGVAYRTLARAGFRV
jgi:two-component system, NarL family, sensor kinase